MSLGNSILEEFGIRAEAIKKKASEIKGSLIREGSVLIRHYFGIDAKDLEMDEFMERYAEAWYLVEFERDIMAAAISKALAGEEN